MADITIRGVEIVGRSGPMDVHVANGVITNIVPTGFQQVNPAATTHIIDGTNCLALPAFIDLHTHTREPGKPRAETAATASAAAAAGGYCAIHAMANTLPVTDTPDAVMAVWNRGRELGIVDIRPVGAITKDLSGTDIAPIAAMHDTAAAPMLFSDDGHCVSRSDLMRAALQVVAEFGGVIAQHAQDPDLTSGAQANEGEPAKRMGLKGWPVVAESAIVARDVLLAADTEARLHVCHVSAAQTVDVLRWAKARGIAVTAEVTPHHLLLHDDLILSGDPVFKVNPPLRSTHDVHAVREALADGTIDAVATDHAPHEAEHKSCAWSDAAMGMLGLETALAVVWQVMVDTGLIDHSRLIDIMSAAPARIGGMVAPRVEVGDPGNLAVIDPHAQWQVDSKNLQSLSNNTPYLGRNLPARVVATLHNGHITHQTERSGA